MYIVYKHFFFCIIPNKPPIFKSSMNTHWIGKWPIKAALVTIVIVFTYDAILYVIRTYIPTMHNFALTILFIQYLSFSSIANIWNLKFLSFCSMSFHFHIQLSQDRVFHFQQQIFSTTADSNRNRIQLITR